jgi:hypothetical protein
VAWCESDLDYWQASEGPNDKAYGTWYKSAFNFRLLCEDLQLDYRYVAPEQILTEDALKRFDLVFLPETIAASPELIERLRRFVRAGGTVVGDFRCLRTNEHGKLYAMDKQPLEELFGVRRLGEAATYGARSVSFVRKHRRIALNGRAMPGTCAEAVTTGAGAVALAEHADGTPAVVVRESGKGRTVYLNLVLPRYNVTARELLRQTVAWAGVPRGVRVTGRDRDKPPRAYQVNRFTSGGNEVVGVIRDYRLCGQEPAVTVRFGRTAHVYDVRAQTYVARGDRVRVQIRPAEAKVYALLPYRVKALRLTAPGQVRAGEDITVRVSVDAEADTVGDHVFRIEVARPDGERVYPYCRNVFAKEGRFTDAIPFALNDATGEWRLSVRDVLTGVMAERTVRVTGR